MIPKWQDIQKTYAASRKRMDIVTAGWGFVNHLHFCTIWRSHQAQFVHSEWGLPVYWYNVYLHDGLSTLSGWFEKSAHRCSYRTSGSSLVIHGRVTDFQMWDNVLPESQLKQVPENITWVSWSSFADHRLPPVQGGQPGQLAGRYLASQFIPRHRESSFSLLDHRARQFTYNPEWLQAKREEMDLEANVCAKSTTSLQILPHLTKVIVMHVVFCVIIMRVFRWSPKRSTCAPSSLER